MLTEGYMFEVIKEIRGSQSEMQPTTTLEFNIRGNWTLCRTYPIDKESLDKAHYFERHLKADWNDGVENDECGDAHESSTFSGQFCGFKKIYVHIWLTNTQSAIV